MRILTTEESTSICGAGEQVAAGNIGGVQDSTFISGDVTAVYKQAVAYATNLIEWAANKL